MEEAAGQLGEEGGGDVFGIPLAGLVPIGDRDLVEGVAEAPEGGAIEGQEG